MCDLLTLLKENVRIISFVGAGGKTTTMYNLAAKLIKEGKSVIITTTTHIYQPENIKVAPDRKSLEKVLQESKLVVAGKPSEKGKLTCLDDDIFNQLGTYGDYVLIEADGAKQMPVKVPKDNEPVIPEWTDMVVGVVGMDCIGKSIESACFRSGEAVKLLADEKKQKIKGAVSEEEGALITEEHLITEEDVAVIISSEKGLRKNVGSKLFQVILNKAENEETIQAAKNIINLIKLKGIDDCLITSHKENERY